ncbi:DUF6471 domain-containing protein [Pandoraea sp. NPDC090278]|uniref:DUF6471 domain-containing protein n=1 Tax=Pandoraea sp. NPDC090278 TaxID=3364391 RepID=UPI00383A282C
MPHVPTPWTALASRAAHVVLARKDMALDDVANAFRRRGFDESTRSVDGKVQRGSFQCAFFLQLLHVCDDEMPKEWLDCFARTSDWFAVSAAIYLQELASITPGGAAGVARIMAEQEGPFAQGAQSAELLGGTFSFARLIMLACDAPMPALDRFLDRKDVIAAQDGRLNSSQ